jgi:hypothetical protein
VMTPSWSDRKPVSSNMTALDQAGEDENPEILLLPNSVMSA